MSLDKSEETLYFHKDFFVLYKHNRAYYFQLLDKEYDKKELVEYIKQSFNLKDLKIKEVENQEQKTLKDESCLIRPKQPALFKFYISYLLVIIFLSLFYTYDKQQTINNELSKIKHNIIDLKTQNGFLYLYEKIYQLNQNANSLDVQIDSYLFKNAKISIKLKSKKKKNIYEFLKRYKSSSLENIDFDKTKKVYFTNAIFRLY